jgi:hypothetical protein
VTELSSLNRSRAQSNDRGAQADVPLHEMKVSGLSRSRFRADDLDEGLLLLFLPGSPEIPRVQRSPVRPTLEMIQKAVAVEFQIDAGQLIRKRKIPARLALAWLARNEAAFRLSNFASMLGVKPWAASHLAAVAQHRAETNSAFRKQLHRLQAALLKITTSQT